MRDRNFMKSMLVFGNPHTAWVPISAVQVVSKGKDWRGWYIKVQLANGLFFVNHRKAEAEVDYLIADVLQCIEEFYDARSESQAKSQSIIDPT